MERANNVSQRIGLLTLPLHTNYGGILQIVALYEYLRATGAEPVLIERATKESLKHRIGLGLMRLLPSALLGSGRQAAHGTSGRSLARRIQHLRTMAKRHELMRTHRPFVEKFLPKRTGPIYDTAGMRKMTEDRKLDALIVGSDQVWRLDYLPRGSIPDYFFGFSEGLGLRRLSYAASFGLGTWKYPDDTTTVSSLIARFDAVSVREDSGLAICREELGRADAEHVLDPTMLVDPAFYDRVAAPSTKQGAGQQLLEYVLDFDADHPDVGGTIAAGLGADFSVRSLVLDGARAPIDIPAWVRAFKDADFVLTDSFHGMVFSIIFRKNFIAIVNRERGADRFTSLLGLLRLEDRLVDGAPIEQLNAIAARPIDYDAVYERLDALRARSADFLRRALG